MKDCPSATYYVQFTRRQLAAAAAAGTRLPGVRSVSAVRVIPGPPRTSAFFPMYVLCTHRGFLRCSAAAAASVSEDGWAPYKAMILPRRPTQRDGGVYEEANMTVLTLLPLLQALLGSGLVW